jgi:hypothetical protein
MAHGTQQRTNARAPTPVFTRYTTLPQSTKDRGVRKLFAALCHTLFHYAAAFENPGLSGMHGTYHVCCNGGWMMAKGSDTPTRGEALPMLVCLCPRCLCWGLSPVHTGGTWPHGSATAVGRRKRQRHTRPWPTRVWRRSHPILFSASNLLQVGKTSARDVCPLRLSVCYAGSAKTGGRRLSRLCTAALVKAWVSSPLLPRAGMHARAMPA